MERKEIFTHRTKCFQLQVIKHDYAIKVNKQVTAPNGRATRGDTAGKLIEQGRSNLAINSCMGDGTRLWNQAPQSVKNCTSLMTAKKEIKKFAASLPI